MSWSSWSSSRFSLWGRHPRHPSPAFFRLALLVPELEELLDEELEEELLEGEVSETSSFSLFPDPLKPSLRFDLLLASDDEPRSSTLA